MKKRINLINLMKTLFSIFKKEPQKILFFFTGFFLAQVLLTNFLYARHPLGGWETAFGNISTAMLLSVFVAALGLCLFALWRSVSPSTDFNNFQQTAH